MASIYYADKTSTQAPAAAANTLTDIAVSLPQDADAWTVANFYQAVKALADFSSLTTGFLRSIFGDGSDGNVTVSTTVSLTRHMYYDTLTVAAGADLQTNGWRIYCKSGLTWTGGKISCNGAAGAAGSGGNGGAGGQTKPGSIAGQRGPHMQGTGGAGGSGAVNGSDAPDVGVDAGNRKGGAGGAGTGGAQTGGNPGRTNGKDATGWKQYPYWLASGGYYGANGTGAPVNTTALCSGSGGGGGAGATSNGGGGGGEAAGIIFVIARSITISGAPTLEAIGGAGGAAQGGNAGGGGGGVGGSAYFIAMAITGVIPTITATAGAGGAGAGTGSAGSAGLSGYAQQSLLVCS